jgi:hypothetical protein
MKILPTLEGGLSIVPESDSDWAVLEMIPVDMERPGHLAESLAGLMDEESEWDQWVVPDLREVFESQSSYVAAAIQYARIQSPAEIYITSKDVDRWYGAINQARLALQAQYHLDALESFDDAPEIVLQAYFRDRFYVFLLGMFLEHVMR